MLFLMGCSSKTVFQSAFDLNTAGAAPSLNQATGTINVSGAPDSVLIEPAPTISSGNWAQIQRAAGLTAPISSPLDPGGGGIDWGR